jgi:hypothetical protein
MRFLYPSPHLGGVPVFLVESARDGASIQFENDVFEERAAWTVVDALWCFRGVEQEGSGARKLAIAVVEKCADKLEPYVRSFLTSVMVEGKSLDSGLHKDHHEVIFELYCCAPQLLSGVIPHINDELVVPSMSPGAVFTARAVKCGVFFFGIVAGLSCEWWESSCCLVRS